MVLRPQLQVHRLLEPVVVVLAHEVTLVEPLEMVVLVVVETEAEQPTEAQVTQILAVAAVVHLLGRQTAATVVQA
jgi:hypothetical protein